MSQLTPEDIRAAEPGHTYVCSKSYLANLGLSCCFRQWRAASHCRFLHGYALEVHMEFEAEGLNDNNWVVDFGSLKPVKEQIVAMLDHKTLVAEDDPLFDTFHEMAERGLFEITVVPSAGVEALSRLIYELVAKFLRSNLLHPRVRLVGVTVREHGANAGGYRVKSL